MTGRSRSSPRSLTSAVARKASGRAGARTLNRPHAPRAPETGRGRAFRPRAGLVPVSIGLIASSAAVVARAVDRDWLTAGISLASAVILYWTRPHPLWIFTAAALIGLVGLA
jgi:hypothetical protein